MKESINVVIVTYNNRELLKRCIGSIIEALGEVSLSATITVVDNNSSDGTDGMIGKFFPSVNHIRNAENEGLSKALNTGIRERLDSDYTLLLNDDVEFLRDTISILVDTLKRYRSAGGIPAALIHSDGTPQWMKLKLLGTQKDHGTRTSSISYSQGQYFPVTNSLSWTGSYAIPFRTPGGEERIPVRSIHPTTFPVSGEIRAMRFVV